MHASAQFVHAQTARASHARPSARHPRRQYAQRSSSFDVSAEPCTTPGFTWERVAAHQCESGEQYTVSKHGDECAYFTKHAASAILAITQDLQTPKTTLTHKFADLIEPLVDDFESLQEVLYVRTISYGQLNKKCKTPTPPADFEAEPDMYTTFDKYVQAPEYMGGWFAEVMTSPRAIMFKFLIEFNVHITDFNEDADGDGPYSPPLIYGLRLEYAQRGLFGVYDSEKHSARQNAIKVTLGHYNAATGRLVAWKGDNNGQPVDYVCIDNIELAHKLFDQGKWPTQRVASDDDGDFEETDMTGKQDGRYNFVTQNDKLCYMGGDKGETAIEIANFCIPQIIALYQFTETGQMPMFKLLCRHRITFPKDGDDDVLCYVRAEQETRAPNMAGVTLMEIEAVVNTASMKSQSDVSVAFQSVNVMLQATIMTPEMLRCYLASIAQPVPTAAIVRWGMQPDGWWVMHNCAFKDGKILSVEDSGHAILPSFFENNEVYSMKATDFPRIIINPYAHVRYYAGVDMWKRNMPAMYLNNLQPARAGLSLAVLGLHATRCWKGETGLGHGMPVGWIYSAEHGTGKSETGLLQSSTCGGHRRGLWGGDATNSVLMEVLSMEVNICRPVDDTVMYNDGVSKPLAKLVRCVYDQTTRAVSGKIRTPQSVPAFTSNELANKKDSAFQSRVLTIHFKALDDKLKNVVNEEDPLMYSRYSANREHMSALLPDLVQVGLYNGKLDKEAMQDWAQFLGKILGKKRDRSTNEWAKLAYIFCNLNRLFQGSADDQFQMFDWMVVQVTRSVHELTNHSGIIDRFIIGYLQVQEAIGPNVLGHNPDKVLHWHNIRLSEKPPMCTNAEKYLAVRVGLVCNVIKALTGATFTESEIYIAAKDSEFVVANARAKFYETASNPWPIKKTLYSDEVAGFDENNRMGFAEKIEVPLQENELLSTTLQYKRCIFIKSSYVDNIRQSISSASQFEVDYKNVSIVSANKHVGTYNFFDAITSGHWFGFRTLVEPTQAFRSFFGAINMMDIGVASEERTVSQVESNVGGYEALLNFFTPDELNKYFTYDLPGEEQFAEYPACYTDFPFEFRNGPADDLMGHDGFFSTDGSVSVSGASSPARARIHDGQVESRGPTTGFSPPRHRPSLANSPLAPRSVNTPNSDGPVAKRPRRMRASPTNLARYPRPPDEVNSYATARQYMAYALARRSHATGGNKKRPMVIDEAMDDDKSEDNIDDLTTEDLVAFVNDDNNWPGEDNHSQGDAQPYGSRGVGRCTMLLGYDDETGEEIICGEECNPAEQACHYCLAGLSRI